MAPIAADGSVLESKKGSTVMQISKLGIILRHYYLFVILLTPLFSIMLPLRALADNWLHFGYDGEFTACNPLEDTINAGNISQMTKKWGIGCDDGGFSVISRSPAIYNDTLFTSGAGNKLSAYDAITGNLLWTFGGGNYGWAPQPVVSENGIVFYLEGSNPTHLYAVNAENGSKLWEAPITFDIGYSETSLVTVDESLGLIYMVENVFGPQEDGNLYALKMTTGEVAWYKSKATDNHNIGYGGDYVLLCKGKIYTKAYVNADGYYKAHIVKIDAASQEIEMIFERPTSYCDVKTYMICNDKLFVRYDSYASDPKTLTVYNTDSPTSSWNKQFSNINGTVACNPEKNLVYVPADDASLYALNATTGAEMWKYTAFKPIYNPSVANGLIYFLSSSNMYAIDEETHAQVFRFPLGYEAEDTSQVAIDNGMLYFSGNGGTCDFFALGFAPTLTGLIITGQTSVSENSTTTYTATASWSDGSTTTVTPSWSEDSAYASITAEGVLAIASTTGNQTVTITADYLFGGISKTASKSVMVVNQTNLNGGYDVTPNLWAKAVLQVSGTPVVLKWKAVGTDITPSGDQVVSGYFYADPREFAYGSEYNPELFVKIYIAKSGWCNMAFNHVTVDNVTVYSAFQYGGSAQQTGTAMMTKRLVEHKYTGVPIQNTAQAEGVFAPAGADSGYTITSNLWAKAVLQPSGGPVTLIWKAVGSDTTPSGDKVVSGYFYADPAYFAYGSEYNPEVLVKIYIAKSGWCNMAFNHVTVDNVTISSAHNYSGAANQTGIATLNSRLVEHQYTGVGIGIGSNFDGIWLGSAVSTTEKDYDGYPCGSGAISLSITNSTITGTASDSYGNGYEIAGTVGTSGAATANGILDGEKVATLMGTLSGYKGNGTFAIASGCNGTWSITKQ
jgi:outer membrane protein assembly factor BamB